MSGWETVAIREVAEVFDGPHATPPKTDEGPWYLSISSLNSGRFDLSRSAHLSAADFPRWTKRVAPRPGDTLFSYETRLGEAAYWEYDYPAALGRRMGLLRPKEGMVESRYLTYAYLGPQFQELIRQKTLSGATVNRISVGEMPSWPILLPSLVTQRKILEIIGAIDDLIENNRRRVEVLEGIARAIYREWFVKFRYPGHEDVPMVDSALGPIPEGWKVGTVRDASIIVVRGISPKYAEDGEWVVINQKCIRDGRVSLGPSRRQERKVSDAKRIRAGDVLINSTGVGTLGRVAMYRGSSEGVTVDSHITIARPVQDSLNPWYAMSILDKQGEIERLGTGATGQTELRKTDVEALELLRPAPQVVDAFAAVVSPILGQIDVLLAGNETLSALRDLLLPKLVTGQIEVSTLDLDALFAEQVA